MTMLDCQSAPPGPVIISPTSQPFHPTNYYRPTQYLPIQTRVGQVVDVGSHPRRHLDEEVGRWATAKWATIPWLDRWFPDGKADFGISCGWADEHGGWVYEDHRWRYAERKPGECCATLVLKKLEWEGQKLFDYAGMQKMLHFVTENDLTADHRPDNWWQDLAHVINYLYDIEPDEVRVGAWTMQALDIWFAGRHCDPENFTVDHFFALAQDGFSRNVPPRAREAWLYSWDDWYDLARATIRKTEVDFQAMERLMKELPTEHTYSTTAYDGTPLKVAFVTESNRQVGPASRWIGYDLCVQLHPKSSPLASGLQIFRNQKRPAGPVDIQPIAYHLKQRSAEYDRVHLPSEVHDLTREQWLVPGYAHPWDRCFLFVADEKVQTQKVPPGEAVFYKSLTAPGIPCPIKPEDVINVVPHCLERYQENPYVPFN